MIWVNDYFFYRFNYKNSLSIIYLYIIIFENNKMTKITYYIKFWNKIKEYLIKEEIVQIDYESILGLYKQVN